MDTLKIAMQNMNAAVSEHRAEQLNLIVEINALREIVRGLQAEVNRYKEQLSKYEGVENE